MKSRRGFLATVSGIATVPFLGKIIEANERDIEEYGQSNIYLDKRELENSSYTEITLKVKVPRVCQFCPPRIPIVTELLNNATYHIYGNSDILGNHGMSKNSMMGFIDEQPKCILLAPSRPLSF